MENRPVLSASLDAETFGRYYYLKEELVAFCRAQGLPASGGKREIAERIARYLETGERAEARPAARKAPGAGEITLETRIEPHFVCSERHRAFFRAQIGAGFTFLVPFQAWLKDNAGKTYAQAVEAYGRIAAEKKRGGAPIGEQFEYNAYIRDFFQDNPGKALAQAIQCWKAKKKLPGERRYERADLQALE